VPQEGVGVLVRDGEPVRVQLAEEVAVTGRLAEVVAEQLVKVVVTLARDRDTVAVWLGVRVDDLEGLRLCGEAVMEHEGEAVSVKDEEEDKVLLVEAVPCGVGVDVTLCVCEPDLDGVYVDGVGVAVLLALLGVWCSEMVIVGVKVSVGPVSVGSGVGVSVVEAVKEGLKDSVDRVWVGV
jgi:hypothetical protein